MLLGAVVVHELDGHPLVDRVAVVVLGVEREVDVLTDVPLHEQLLAHVRMLSQESDHVAQLGGEEHLNRRRFVDRFHHDLLTVLTFPRLTKSEESERRIRGGTSEPTRELHGQVSREDVLAPRVLLQHTSSELTHPRLVVAVVSVRTRERRNMRRPTQPELVDEDFFDSRARVEELNPTVLPQHPLPNLAHHLGRLQNRLVQVAVGGNLDLDQDRRTEPLLVQPSQVSLRRPIQGPHGHDCNVSSLDQAAIGIQLDLRDREVRQRERRVVDLDDLRIHVRLEHCNAVLRKLTPRGPLLQLTRGVLYSSPGLPGGLCGHLHCLLQASADGAPQTTVSTHLIVPPCRLDDVQKRSVSYRNH